MLQLEEKLLSDLNDDCLVEIYISTQRVEYFDEIYKRYSNKIFYKCYSMLNDLALAEDSTQEIFIKIILNLSKFVGKSRFSTWIYSITYNHCIDQVRTIKKQQNLFEVLDEVADDVADNDNDLDLEMTMNTFKSTLEIIDEADRMLLIMKYQDNLMVRDIADILEITESAVKMRLKRAKEKFMKMYYQILKE